MPRNTRSIHVKTEKPTKTVKQILIWRKDLNVRKGKIAAQIAHASVAFLVEKHRVNNPTLTKEEYDWINTGQRKICVYVENEAELLLLYEKAKAKYLTTHLVIDSGLTEFDGVPTKTCISIGPHYSEKIDELTSQLKLL